VESVHILQSSGTEIIQMEIILILSLLLITGVAWLERKFRFPYTVALVFAGLLLALASNVINANLGAGEIQISTQLILTFFVPPLIFEGALHINWRTFRANLPFILLMAVVGVLLSTLLIGILTINIVDRLVGLATSMNIRVLTDLKSIPFVAAIAFGALISATDPVAVIAFFRSLGVDKRLSILMEGESLLNDGTSIVIFNIALVLGGAAAFTHGDMQSFDISLPQIFWEFTKVSAGGILIGMLVGKLTEMLLVRTDNRLVETTITIPAAFGAYLLAEQLGLSGILSVVAAGIYLGDKIPRETSPTTKIALFNFWEVLSFIVTSLIFLIIGWVIDIRQLLTLQNLLLVIAAVISILVARVIVVYGMSFVGNYIIPALGRLFGLAPKLEHVPASYQHVMFWGGLRGAISLALALSLDPNAFGPGIGQELRLMTFGVVLFTLLVQGITIEGLIKRLGLAAKSTRQQEKERLLGQYYAALAAREELNRLHERGLVPASIWEAIKETQMEELKQHDQEVRDMLHRYPGMEMELAIQTRRLVLQAERTALGQAVQREVLSEEIQEDLIEELDAHIQAVELLSNQNATRSRMDESSAGSESDER